MYNFSVRNFVRSLYLPTICCMCGKKAAECTLKACSGCKLIAYCSASHQKLHWPDHKRLCKAASAIASKANCSHLFQHTFESVSLWKEYRDVIMLGLVKELNRPLDSFEQQTIFNPNCCTVCHKYEKSMLTCDKCSYVWYCSSQHKTLDADAHSKLCQHFSNLLRFHIGYIALADKNVCEGFFVTNTNKFPDFLESFMNDNVYLVECSTYLGEKLCKIHASDSFSFPMTAVNALKQCGLFSRTRDLVIHVVGAHDMEPNDINLWKCLDIVQNDFDNISIVLVGPDLNLKFFSRSLSDSEVNSTSKFKFKASKTLYHTFYLDENVKSRPPDLIIAFNCGFHAGNGPDEPDTWKETIPYFCKHPNTAIAFTSYSIKEAEVDLDYFIENCAGRQLEIIVKHEQNPFRSLKPNYVVWESHEDALFFANNFISILKTK